jgi:hypothetical protein
VKERSMNTKTELYGSDFNERAKQAMQDRFARPDPARHFAQLLLDQEAAIQPADVKLSVDASRLQANFERDRKILGDHISDAFDALARQWGLAHDIDHVFPRPLGSRLHIFGADRAGTGGPFVYTLSWGNIEGGTGGAGIGVNTNLREGTFSASHFTHGSNQFSSYAGIGVRLTPTVNSCILSVRPLVNWSGYDILSHRIFDPQLNVSAWVVAGAQIGVHIQSEDRAGGGFRDDASRWETVWQRSEINPSGSRSYNDTADARTLQVDVLASGNRNYVIWVSCRAFVITQAKFGLDTWASSSVSCQLPFLFIEEVDV